MYAQKFTNPVHMDPAVEQVKLRSTFFPENIADIRVLERVGRQRTAVLPIVESKINILFGLTTLKV
jgi:hypothetical protein